MNIVISFLAIFVTALAVLPTPVYAKNKKENRGHVETIRVTKMKYDCYLDSSFSREKKEYATTDSEAEDIKENIDNCVTTGDDVTDPKYVIRYRVSGVDELKKAFLDKEDWLSLTPGCYSVRIKKGNLSDFNATSCE